MPVCTISAHPGFSHPFIFGSRPSWLDMGPGPGPGSHCRGGRGKRGRHWHELHASRQRQIPLDIKEAQDTFEVTADIPGVRKEDIHVQVHNKNTLTLTVHTPEDNTSEHTPAPTGTAAANPDTALANAVPVQDSTNTDEAAKQERNVQCMYEKVHQNHTDTPTPDEDMKGPTGEVAGDAAGSDKPSAAPEYTWHCNERTKVFAPRCIRLPATVDAFAATAAYVHGVLTLTIPKKPEVETSFKLAVN